MSEFERRIRDARRASREIATQVQQMIEEGRGRRGETGAPPPTPSAEAEPGEPPPAQAP